MAYPGPGDFGVIAVVPPQPFSFQWQPPPPDPLRGDEEWLRRHHKPSADPAQVDAQQVFEAVRRAPTEELVRELKARGATITWAPAPKGE